ncbi:MAG: NUDIX domain-containing protein [Candidatus Aenigmarchaeota archaeon]|nr:NUDIX domain-containing protein [Candidatus Aenigmarchaeota archaeon]
MVIEKKRRGESGRKSPDIQSSHAILIKDDEYVLQLRDDKLSIAAPGQWSLFGGIKRKDETPLSAVQREIKEELSIEPSDFQYLWFKDYYSSFEKEIIRTYFFSSDVSSEWPGHKLMEGQAVGIYHIERIRELDMPPVIREAIYQYHESRKN